MSLDSWKGYRDDSMGRSAVSLTVRAEDETSSEAKERADGYQLDTSITCSWHRNVVYRLEATKYLLLPVGN